MRGRPKSGRPTIILLRGNTLTGTATTTLTAVFLLTMLPVKAETLLDRGTYLVESIVACGNCHTAPVPGSPDLAGFENLSVVPEFTAHAPNITQDTGEVLNFLDKWQGVHPLGCRISSGL